MRNFINFIIRSWFIIFFIVLQGVALLLLFNSNAFHRASFINSSNAVAGRVYETQSTVTDYFNLKQANKDLAEENARLKAMLPSAYEITDRKFFAKNDTLYFQKYSYTVAKVINNSVDRRNNYLTLNKGSIHGIRPQMAVVSPNGIVGVVKSVSANYTTVLSLLHKAVKISAKVKRTDNFGSLVWDGANPDFAYMEGVASYVKLKKGDTIITTSYSDIFPEGVMVGTVDAMEEKSTDAFHKIKVKLSTNFNTLSYVYVIKDLTRQERDSLENATISKMEDKETNGD